MASHPDASQPRQDGSGHPWASTSSPARQGSPGRHGAPDNEQLATRWPRKAQRLPASVGQPLRSCRCVISSERSCYR